MLALVVAVASVLTLAGCQSDPPSNQPAAPPKTSPSDPPGKLAQIVTKPGRYTVGTDIEPGDWVGMAGSSMCNYSTVRKVDGSRPISKKIAVAGGTRMFDDAGIEIGWATMFRFWPGDVLEIPATEFYPDMEVCQFWNEGTDAPPVPQGSDVPWRDVDRTTVGTERWKMGQFDYLDAVKARVNNFDETQLTSMGLWSCKVKNRTTAGNTLQHFAHLTSIQADYLITMSYKYMCPSDQHS